MFHNSLGIETNKKKSHGLACMASFRALKGCQVSSKKLCKGSETGTKELLGGTKRALFSPMKGSLILPPGKSVIFFTKKANSKKLSDWPQTWGKRVVELQPLNSSTLSKEIS